MQLSLIPNPEKQNNRFDYIIDNLEVAAETKIDYKSRLKSFIAWLDTNPLHENTLQRYKEHLKEKYESISSRNKYFVVAKLYLQEMYRMNELPRDYTVGVKSFKNSIKHKKFGQNQEEAQKLKDKLEYFPLRDRLIVSLMMYQGLREVEITRIENKDIYLFEKYPYLLVQGKGEDDKEVIHLHPKVTEMLKLYMLGVTHGKLVPLSTRMIRYIFAGICKTLGIENTSAHGLRHYFVTTMIGALGEDLTEVQKYTRHKTLDMLIVYNDELQKEKTLDKFYAAFE